MKSFPLILFFVTCFIHSYAQDLNCITSGSGANTTTISATSACGHHFGGSVSGVTNHNDDYSCLSGSHWIGGEAIYYFTDVVKGTYTFTLSGFATDLDLFILSGCDESKCISAHGAYGRSGRTESVTIDLADGQSVYLVVDGKFVSSASFVLSIDCAGSVCDDLKGISCGSVVRGANEPYDRNATDVIDSHGSCGGSGYTEREVVYRLNTYSSPITIDLHPLDKRNIDLFVYDDCSGGLSDCLGSSTISPRDESIYLASGGNGGDIYIAVDGSNHSPSYSTTGSFELAITCGDPCDQRATKIGCNSVIHGTTKGKANNASYYSCDGAHNKGHNWGPEQVYEFTIDETQDIEIDLEVKSNVDLNLYLLKNWCSATSCIESSKNDHRGGSERIRERLSRGKYYIVVEGYQGDKGDFALSLFGCGCSKSTTLKCNKPINGSLSGRSNNVTKIKGDCFQKAVMLDNEDQLYHFKAEEYGYYSFMLHSFHHGMDLFITSDCADPEACIAKSTQSGDTPEVINLQMNKGQEVFVLVDGLINYAGSRYTVEVTCGTPPDNPDHPDNPDEPDDKPDDEPTDEEPTGGDPDEEPEEEPTEENEVLISCGMTVNGSTIGNRSRFGRTDYTCFRSSLDFRGGESIVTLQKTSDDHILSVHMFHGGKTLENLSLFIMDSTYTEVDNCKGKNFRKDKSIGNGNVVGEYYTDRSNPLPAGKYYAVLDGYNSRVASEFSLTATCSELDCEGILGLPCGESLLPESTANAYNNESIYQSADQNYVGYTGGENLYSFCLDSTTMVDISLYGIAAIDSVPTSDIDMFLMTNVCSSEKQVLAASTNAGLEEENIKIELEAGEYYIVVDGWDGARANYSIRNETCYASLCGKSIKSLSKNNSNEIPTAYEIDVLPNPFTNDVGITLNGFLDEKILINVYDLSGVLISSLSTFNDQEVINVSSLFENAGKGAFLIQVIGEQQSVNERVIRM